MLPDISVITTVYNCEKFIQDSLESMSNQTLQDFEWIIVNDGSTDSTWDIVQSFKHPNIILIDNKDNARIPQRRNEAIEVAKGKYIAIHDGDDISLPDRLQKQHSFFKENDNIFAVGGWAIQIDENNDTIKPMCYPPTSSKDVVNSLLHKRMNPIIDPTSMFRRDRFLKLGRYTLEKAIYTVPDMDLWSRAIIEGYELSNMREFLIKYRLNANGMTRLYKSEMIEAHKIVWRRFYHGIRKYRPDLFLTKEANYEVK